MRTVWIAIIAVTLLPVTASADSYRKNRQLKGEYVSRELQVCAQDPERVLFRLRNSIRTFERVYDGKGGGTATLLNQNIDLQKPFPVDPTDPFVNLIVGQPIEGECDIEVDVAPDLSVVETLMCQGLQLDGRFFRFSTTRQGQLTRNRSVMNYGVNPAERQVVEVWNVDNRPPNDPDFMVFRDCIIEGTAIKKIKKRIRRDGDNDDNDDDDDDDDD